MREAINLQSIHAGARWRSNDFFLRRQACLQAPSGIEGDRTIAGLLPAINASDQRISMHR
jgi:hypothetical protein